MARNVVVNNDIYERMGEGWYGAADNPVALLRAEHALVDPWVLENLPAQAEVLDIGCGGGFLSNFLARAGCRVTGLDASPASLAVARAHDATGRVSYHEGNAYALPFADSSFDVVCAMDFLEHVDEPQRVIAEAARVLKPGGRFFFHTFSRTWLAWVVVIKLVEWFVPNTERDMHVLHLFLKPSELRALCARCGLGVREFRGTCLCLTPRFLASLLFKRQVPPDTRFVFTRFLGLGYVGYADKR